MWNMTDQGAGERRGGAAEMPPPVPMTKWLLAAALAGLLAVALPAVAQDAAAAQDVAAEDAATEPAAAVAPPQGTPAEAVAAPDAPAEAPPVAGDERPGLAALLAERYRALPTRDGVMLVPRQEIVGIRSIEVADGEVAINGEAVSPTILRSWLGDEAAPLLALAALDEDEARALLAVEGEAAGPGAQGAAGEAEAMADEDAEAAAGLAEPPEPPAPPAIPDDHFVHQGQQFKIGGDIVVDDNEVASDAFALGGSVLVRGKVRKDVVAIGGSVEVSGEVGGEIVSVLGGVVLGPDAVVNGNVTAVGSGVKRAPGSRVRGEITEVSVPGSGGGDIDWEDWVDSRSRHDRLWLHGSRLDDAYLNLVGAAILALLVCLALLVGRGVVERVERRVSNTSDFLVAGLVGVAVQLLLLPVVGIVTILLVITIVGCLALPLIPFLLLALLVAALFGYAGVALRAGRWLQGRFGLEHKGPYLAALLGVALIEVWKLVGESLDVFGGPAWFFSLMFVVVGVVVEYVAWSVGLGAILINLIEGRRSRAVPPPPPPGHHPPGGLPPASPQPPSETAAAAATAADGEAPPPAEGWDAEPLDEAGGDAEPPAEPAGGEGKARADGEGEDRGGG